MEEGTVTEQAVPIGVEFDAAHNCGCLAVVAGIQSESRQALSAAILIDSLAVGRGDLRGQSDAGSLVEGGGVGAGDAVELLVVGSAATHTLHANLAHQIVVGSADHASLLVFLETPHDLEVLAQSAGLAKDESLRAFHASTAVVEAQAAILPVVIRRVETGSIPQNVI